MINMKDDQQPSELDTLKAMYLDLVEQCMEHQIKNPDATHLSQPVNADAKKKRWVVQSCETIGHTDRLRFEAHEAKVGKTDNVVLADGFEMHLNSKVYSIRECE